jgi:hypothetical protein
VTHAHKSRTSPNVAIMTTGYGEGGYGEGRYGGAAELKIKDDSDDVSFDKCTENMLSSGKHSCASCRPICFRG